MKSRKTPWITLALLLVAHRSAHAQTKESCIAAAEEADVLRRDMTKLTKAQERLRVCAAEECPSLVRDDCRRWIVEVEENLPTIVFVAEDENGKSAFDVAVSIDGQPLVAQLDGKPVAVDAGAHTFSFVRPGGRALAVPVIVRAGQKNVEVAGRFPRRTPAPAVVAAPTGGDSHPTPATPPPRPGRSTLAYAGLGTAVL